MVPGTGLIPWFISFIRSLREHIYIVFLRTPPHHNTSETTKRQKVLGGGGGEAKSRFIIVLGTGPPAKVNLLPNKKLIFKSRTLTNLIGNRVMAEDSLRLPVQHVGQAGRSRPYRHSVFPAVGLRKIVCKNKFRTDNYTSH